mgnify:CR=1 FL=1
MTNPRLPSLNLIRVFETAARPMNFQGAADEPFVSPPAVSHHIQALEASLGVTILKREHRKSAPTAQGTSY